MAECRGGRYAMVLNWGVRQRLASLRRSASEKGGERSRTPLPIDRVEAHATGKTLCVVSGKGGTGKSMISASLATLLARRAPTLLFDADLGVGNAHILQGVSPKQTVADVLCGRVSVRDALQACGSGLQLLAGGSGIAQLANLHSSEIDLLAAGLSEVEPDFAYFLVDSAAGLSRQTMAFAAASDLVLLVTTPAVTSLTDAYAFLKVLWARSPGTPVRVVLNRVHHESEGHEAAERLSSVAKRFLGQDLLCIATLPEDPSAFRATQERRPVVRCAEPSPLVTGLRELEGLVRAELGNVAHRGFGGRLLDHLFA